jgi:hypothetical protein
LRLCFLRVDVQTLRLCFLRVDVTLFLAGGHKALSRAELDALSRGQTFRLCFSQAVVIAGG